MTVVKSEKAATRVSRILAVVVYDPKEAMKPLAAGEIGAPRHPAKGDDCRATSE
jgi:hypothetical protein